MHLVRLEMLINKENLNDVNYLIGFECDDGFVPSIKKGKACNYLPIDVRQRCKSKVFTAWSYGSLNVNKKKREF